MWELRLTVIRVSLGNLTREKVQASPERRALTPPCSTRSRDHPVIQVNFPKAVRLQNRQTKWLLLKWWVGLKVSRCYCDFIELCVFLDHSQHNFLRNTLLSLFSIYSTFRVIQGDLITSNNCRVFFFLSVNMSSFNGIWLGRDIIYLMLCVTLVRNMTLDCVFGKTYSLFKGAICCCV